MVRKKNSLNKIVNDNFFNSINYLKKIKNYFFFSLLFFSLIVIIGFLFPIFFEQRILDIIESLVKQTEGLGLLELIRFIISNNVFSSFIAMITGVFLALPSLAVILVNGYILGFVAEKSVGIAGYSILLRLLPHGIFEIPAILISAALGIKLGILFMYDCIKKYYKKLNKLNTYLLILLSMLLPISFIIYLVLTINNKDLRKNLIGNLTDSFRVFLLVVIPLLVIAGIIEGILVWLLN